MNQIDRIARVLAPQPASTPTEGAEEWLDVQALYRILRRQMGLIVATGACVLLAALPLVLGVERSFSSATRVLIQEPLPAALASSGLLPEAELNLTTEGERLLSRDVSVRVVTDLGLARLPEFNPALRERALPLAFLDGLRGLLPGGGLVDAEGPDPMDRIVQEYLGHLKIWRAPGSDVVNIGFTSRDATLAALVPNTLIHVYLDQRESQIAARIATAEAWLDGRIADQRERLAAAVAAAEAMGEAPEVVLADALGPGLALSRLDESRAAVQRDRAEINAKLAALDGAADLETRAAAVDTEAIIRLRTNLDEERNELARLSDRYGPANEKVIAAKTRVSDLERSIDAEVDRERRRLSSRMAALTAGEARILDSLTEAQRSLAQAGSMRARLAQLQRVIDNERDAMDRLEDQARALKAEAQLPAAEIEILSPAAVPLVAEGHGRSYYLAVALVAAGGLSLTAAFFREMIDRSVRSHDQLKRIPSLRPAGLVPALPRRRPLRFWRKPGQGRQVYSDALRGLILSLEESDGRMPDSLLVTSALPGEGKTTLAVALAAEMAAAGQRVLLVDADQRGGRIAARFGAPPAPGFSDYLAGEVDVAGIVHHDRASGIAFVPRGSGRPQAALDRRAVRALAEWAESQGRIVLFDGPPALVNNESLLLAGVATRTLLVVRWGETDRTMVETAAERLAQRCGGSIDAVICRVDLQRQALYGYSDAGVLSRTLWRYHKASA